MQRTPVESSQIASVGFDKAGGILEVEFNNSAVYQYSGVTEDQYRELMSAASPGKYLNANIKPVNPYVRIEV